MRLAADQFRRVRLPLPPIMKKITQEVMKSLFLLEDFRELLRETKPEHEFNKEQYNKGVKILEKLENNIKKIKKDMK